MLEKKPSLEELNDLIGQDLCDIWIKLCAMIDLQYEMDRLWNSGGKAWTYEYKYRRGGKTLCALYARENSIGFMVILGKAERDKFEADRNNYSETAQKLYDESETFHDGKWLMVELTDTSLFPDMEKLLHIKRRPNRK